MNTSLAFCFRHSLDPVRTGFKFKARIHIGTADTHDDFFKTTVFTLVSAHHFGTPALCFSKAGVHTIEITRENGGLITAGTRADFDNHIAAVVRVFWQQQNFDSGFQISNGDLRRFKLFLPHGAHIRVVITGQHFRFFLI